MKMGQIIIGYKLDFCSNIISFSPPINKIKPG